jgi:hypothetical protein
LLNMYLYNESAIPEHMPLLHRPELLRQNAKTSTRKKR